VARLQRSAPTLASVVKVTLDVVEPVPVQGKESDLTARRIADEHPFEASLGLLWA
jgi:hypothetical protein